MGATAAAQKFADEAAAFMSDVDHSTRVLDIEVPDSELARIASDHLPLIVEVRLPDRDKLRYDSHTKNNPSSSKINV